MGAIQPSTSRRLMMQTHPYGRNNHAPKAPWPRAEVGTAPTPSPAADGVRRCGSTGSAARGARRQSGHAAVRSSRDGCRDYTIRLRANSPVNPGRIFVKSRRCKGALTKEGALQTSVDVGERPAPPTMPRDRSSGVAVLASATSSAQAFPDDVEAPTLMGPLSPPWRSTDTRTADVPSHVLRDRVRFGPGHITVSPSSSPRA